MTGLRLCLIGYLALILPFIAASQEKVYTAPVYPTGWSKPGLLPDRIILTFSGDPATTQSVTWRTDTSISTGFAEIAIADASPSFWINSTRHAAVTSTLDARKVKTAEVISNYHSITFNNLLPDTNYAYRVGDGQHWSEWFQFKTASKINKPFSFLYLGDAQNYILERWSRLLRTAFLKAPEARFIIYAGDLVSEGHSEQQWHEWFSAGGWLHAMLPAVPTPGNHEYRAINDGLGALSKPLSVQWKNQFTLPENGISRLPETNYYFDYQDVRIISLNSNEHLGEQAKWLDKILSETRAKWKVITFHHPVYSGAGDRDNKQLRQLWKPVFDKYKVDLVLTGHDHTYTRGQSNYTEPSVINKATGTNVANGTVYVVSVSGGKMYTADADLWKDYGIKPVKEGENTQLFQTISVDGNKISYQSFTATGILYDAFDLIKDEKTGLNKLVEKEQLPTRTFGNTIKE